MRKLVKFTPMNDIVKRVKLKPVVMFKAGEIYTGVLHPNNMILGYTDKSHKSFLLKRALVRFI